MKGKVVFPMLLIILIATIFIGSPSFSVTINKEQSSTMIKYGDKALLDGDYEMAKNFYRRALQYDPYSINAWKKYETMIQVITQGKKIDLEGLNFCNQESTARAKESNVKQSEKQKATKQQTEKQKALEGENKGGFIFQGC